MPFEMWVGFRYLMSKRSSVFVSFIAIMTVLGVVLGVAALNVTLSVMTGFEDDLKSKIIGMNAHAVVLSHLSTFEPDPEVEKKIRETPGVIGVTPFTYNELLMQEGSQVTGVILKGADPATIGQVTDLVSTICLPNEDGEPCEEKPGERMAERQAIMDEIAKMHVINDGAKTVPGILLGRELANQLFVADGETVSLVAPSLGVGPGGTPFPKVRTFYVVGMFRTGMWEYDQKFAFTGIEAAQKMSGDEGRIAGLEIKTDDLYAAPHITNELNGVDDEGNPLENPEHALEYPWVVKSWRDLNGALFSALRLEKFVMGLLLSIIVIVASFSIVSILTLIVLEKAKEIAILKSMGASNGMVLGVFAVQGFVIGLAGVTIGSLVGYALAWFLRWWEWKLDTQVYYLDSLPVIISPLNFLVVGAAGLAITFVAGLLPSIVAARQRPVAGLQYD